MDRRPFRFAVQATNATSARDWHETARRAEDLGYSTLFLADHYLGPGPAQAAARTPRQDLAPIAAIATAAAVTSTLRVGCRVFCIDYHVPAVLAKEAMTLDLLSDGRLELGIGAGWSEIEYTAMGLDFAAPPRRIAKLREVVALVKDHAAGAQLAHAGEFVDVRGYAGTPPPVQRPHPPIMIGGGGRRVLTYAAREADIVSINSVPFTELTGDGLTPQQEEAKRFGYVRDAAGARLGELDIESSPYFTSVTERPDDAVRRVAKAVGMNPDSVRQHPNVLIGSAAEIADRLLRRRDEVGVNYVTVQQSQLEKFAPVAQKLQGS